MRSLGPATPIAERTRPDASQIGAATDHRSGYHSPRLTATPTRRISSASSSRAFAPTMVAGVKDLACAPILLISASPSQASTALPVALTWAGERPPTLVPARIG